ncbi:MAG: hypothetical protein H7070_04760 [Saprospiraceae bacterium]|nr:hypothetical protein [Pyrinomonadaceae bacterium]
MSYSSCLKFVVLLNVLLMFVSCTQDNASGSGSEIVSIPTPTPEARVLPADKKWVRIFFREIDGRIEGSDIGPLREKKLLPGEKEVRIWVGFDLYPLNGIILRQNEGKWTGSYVLPVKLSSSSKPITALREPKSGWNALWQRLEELDFYTLPDSEDIGATNAGTDAKGAVIEIKTKESYRTYMYGGLRTPEADETKKVVEICRTLSREFGVDLFEGPERVGIRDGP